MQTSFGQTSRSEARSFAWNPGMKASICCTAWFQLLIMFRLVFRHRAAPSPASTFLLSYLSWHWQTLLLYLYLLSISTTNQLNTTSYKIRIKCWRAAGVYLSNAFYSTKTLPSTLQWTLNLISHGFRRFTIQSLARAHFQCSERLRAQNDTQQCERSSGR